MGFGKGESKMNMNKEKTPLQALNNIKNLFIGSPINQSQQFEIIETALKRLEKIDNTTTKMNNKKLIMFDEEVGKRLKALEIIKEKGNFLCLHYSEYENKYYIYDAELYMHNELTKEEYELLKEILK